MTISERLSTALLDAINSEQICLQTEETSEDAIASFRKFLEEAQGEVQIAASNLNSEPYNHPQIISLLEELEQRKVAIKITHPKTQCPPDALVNLTERKVIKIYPTGQEITYDFWIIDRLNTLIENPSGLGEKKRVFFISRNVDLLARRLQSHFDFLKVNP